ncbi:MAG: hypothetical protein Kow0056_01680 [Coriobacteriia bacterium]
MKYRTFERLVLTVGGLAIAGTVAAGFARATGYEEIVGQALLLVVLVGAVHWGRNGGYATAVIAALGYILLRVPLLMDQGLTPTVTTLLVTRTLAFAIVGILGGELCTRMKYIFAAMDEANTLDMVTHVFNERFAACRLKKLLGEFDRYGNDFSVILMTIDPAIYASLNKARMRRLLRDVASHIRSDIRIVDDVARLNDNRFIIILPQTGRDGAGVVSDRIHKNVCERLGARLESVKTSALGTPEDKESLEALLESLDQGGLDEPCEPKR